MIPDARKLSEISREELLAELARLDARERALRIARANITYDFEYVLKEKLRLQRHLESLGAPVEEATA